MVCVSIYSVCIYMYMYTIKCESLHEPLLSYIYPISSLFQKILKSPSVSPDERWTLNV